MEKLIQFFLRNHRLFLIASLVFIASLFAFLPKFKLSPAKPTPIAYPSPDDPNRLYLEGMQKIFGEAEITLIGLETPDVFNPSTIRKIERMTQAVEKISGVESVLSLSNAQEVDSKRGTLNSDDLIKKIPMSDEGMRLLKDKVAKNRLLKGRLVSDDGTLATILVSEVPGLPGSKTRAISQEMREIALKEEGPEKIVMTGVSVVDAAMTKTCFDDVKKQFPLVSILCFLILIVNFKGFRNVLICWITMVAGIFATFGVLAIVDIPLTALIGILPALLLVTGLSYTLYLLSEFYSQSQKGGFENRRDVVEEVLRQVWFAVFLCALTTVIGFASLCTSRIVGIRQMGLAASIGTVIMLLLNMITLSAGLFYLAAPPRREAKVHREDLLDRLLRRLHRFAFHRSTWVLIGAFILLVLSLWGASRMVSETDPSKFFKKGHPIRDDLDLFSQKLHGAIYMNIFLQGKGPDRFLDPILLSKIDRLQEGIEHLPHVAQVLSVNDFLKWTNRLLHDDNPDEEKIPEGRDAVGQSLLIYEMSDPHRELSRYLTEDGSAVRLSIRSSVTRSLEIQSLAQHIEQLCQKEIPSDIPCRVTSESILGAQTSKQLTDGMISGFVLGIGLILVLMMFVLRSVKMGIIAMIPNVLPILVSLGVIGWAGFPLDACTSLMAPIVIGMTVDDTIRFFVRYFFELRKTNHYMIRQATGVRVTEDQKIALERTFEELARPMVLASLIIISGFGILMFSSFVPVERLGILTALTMLICVLGDLFLLPAILTRIKI